MPALQKFTTSYSETEDRLKFAGEVKDEGHAIVLWLTQRMANRLVEVLTHWLDEDAQARGRFAADLHNAFAQEAATRRLESTQPVSTSQAIRPLLVTSVDLRREGERYVVVFRGAGQSADDDPPLMRLSDTELRQWLGIVHGLYRAAGWPLSAWPEWIGERQESAAARPGLLH